MSKQPDTNLTEMESIQFLKEFGNKARARLDEEKSKRPEIKMLNSAPTKESREKKSNANSFIFKQTAKTASARVKRKRKSVPRQSSKQRGKADEWSPDVSHISVPSKESRSTLVKLHGLPFGCSLDHIKAFFAGLQPERILILLTNRADIPELDPFMDAPSVDKILQDRYENYLRVFVKFESGPAAALASERSGETITMRCDSEDPSSTGMETRKSFSIGVTQISKGFATVLSVLSFSPGGEEPFHIALSRVENQLHPIVSKALWAEAAQDLGIAVDEAIRTANLLADDADPLTLVGYQRLARHHNKLVEIHDDLLQQLPFPSVEVSETDYSSKPVTRLTKAASNALVKEIERIDSILYRTRVTYRIQKSKGQYGETPVFKT